MEKKKLVIGVIGADVHAVGNTILNNAFKQAGFDVVNLGVMVTQEEYIQAAIESGADAILVSQTVTQKDIHIMNLTKMAELMEAEGLRDKMILTCGGPRISHELAQELGYDAGFGPGKYADHVMSYIMQEVVKRGWEKKADIADR
jgi:beta-lysine 5,6-aminomutase beta subunit